MDARDIEALLAVEDARAAIALTGNLPTEERQAAALRAMLILQKRLFPVEVASGVLDGFITVAEELVDRAPTAVDVFGGNAVPARKEFLCLLLSAVAHAFAARAGIRITKARRRVVDWSAREVSLEKLRQWGVGGETTLREGRASMLQDAIEHTTVRLAGVPTEKLEAVLGPNVRALATRFAVRAPRKRT